MKTGVVTKSAFDENGCRIDPSFHLSEGVAVRRLVESSPYPLMKCGDAASRIFNGGRYKRIYVSNPKHGVPLISSSGMLKADLSDAKLVSKKFSPELEDRLVQAGWILISRSGTIGNTAFTNAGHAQKLASEHVIRLLPNDILRGGYMYAYLSSKYGYSLLTQGTFGSVIQHIECPHVASLPIPVFPTELQNEIDSLIRSVASLRDQANELLDKAKRLLKESAGLRDLTKEDYNFFGAHTADRKLSAFKRSNKEIGTTSFNAFNHGERFRNALAELDKIPSITLREAISDDGWKSPGGVEVTELKPGNGVMLINQKDIFDTIVTGKWVPKKSKYESEYLEYGEILIAKIGTLGENETFCRTIFVNEELQGKLVSSAFYRLKASSQVPVGYFYCWLSSDWGFRQLRSSHFGAKLCYPNPTILNEYRLPILSPERMLEIDKMVKDAHTMFHQANNNERKAISMVESEIESWNYKPTKK